MSSRRLFLPIALAIFGAAPSAQAQVITTVAGGDWVFRGDGGPARSAPLGNITGVAVDAAGNVYAADSSNHIVVRISADGVLFVVAGNGIPGFSGDGGPATSASLLAPGGVAVDSAGNVFIADTLNNRIREVSGGTIATIAGTGAAGYSGDGGQAVSALLNAPTGVVVDNAGNLYFADTFNQRIRKIGSTGQITTLAGNGMPGFTGDNIPAVQASLSSPRGIATDNAGNFFIADWGNQRIRQVDPNGSISTIAGTGLQGFAGDGGPANLAAFSFPYGVALDSFGNLYVSDSSNERIRMIRGGSIVTVAGNGAMGFGGDGGAAVSAALNLPQGICVDAGGTIYIGDTFNTRVRRISPAGIITTTAGNGLYRFSGDGGPATSASLNSPQGLAVDGAGRIYTADSLNNRVRKVNAAGVVTTLAGNGARGFSGDGGPATLAALSSPAGVAADPSGAVYIADSGNNRIRKVDPAGKITTFAGTGAAGFSGDAVPATIASLNQPLGVAADPANNIYVADTADHRVRKIDATGIITTIAGTGKAGFGGDGGLAAGATLNSPSGLTLDGSGNLYIADTNNHRVRKVDRAGTISTIAGNGTAGSSGDGGPATGAMLNSPTSVAVDASGNLYIAEGFGNRIRQVTGGIISTVAGSGIPGFSGDGGPATSAALNQPLGVVADTGGNLYIADSLNSRVREVLASAPSFALSTSILNFTIPFAAPVAPAQLVSVSSSVTGLAWAAIASTEGGGSWLAVLPSTGAVPGIISVSVTVTGLNPGTYSGSVRVLAFGANPGARTVSVSLTVQPPSTPQLVTEPSNLIFSIPTGSIDSAPQTLRIANPGQGTLNWTAQVLNDGGAGWLSISAQSGTASVAAPADVQASVTTSGLQPGVYSATIQVTAPSLGQTQNIVVTLLFGQPSQAILLSQTGLLFTGVEGGPAIPAQSVGILNVGQGQMNWSIQANTPTGDAWLSVATGSGSSIANSLQVPTVDVGAAPGFLKAAHYSGLLRVDAPTANNSPQFLTVDLGVLPAGSNPGILVRPTGLIFAARQGTSSPSSQLINLATASPNPTLVQIGAATFDTGQWLNVLPHEVLVSPGSPAILTVQTTLGSLAAGQYRGAITLLFSDGSPAQLVNVLFVVVPAPAAAASAYRPFLHGQGVASCVARTLLMVQSSLNNNFFSATAGWPNSVEAKVTDDCGWAVTGASVIASFSNGDTPIVLISQQNGTYSATWAPTNASNRVTMSLRANLAPLASAEVQIEGQVGGNSGVPAISAGVFNGASFAPGNTLAPGSIMSVFGNNFSTSSSAAGNPPLPTTLAGANLYVGGIAVPLFFANEGQMTGQMPFELASKAGTQVQLILESGSSYAVPQVITVAPASPGIFTSSQDGQGQGTVLDSQGRTVDANAPASAGDIVTVLATGLGVTSPLVASGAAAPAQAVVTAPVRVTVGGIPANTQPAVLVPGSVGLYQISVQIPAGVAPGPAVPLMMLQQNAPSNIVTLAVQ